MHYNKANNYVFVNGTAIYKFKAKDYKNSVPICLGKISKDWWVDNMKRTEFTAYLYDFSVDCDPIAVDDIKDIHKIWWRKIIWYDMIYVLKQYFQIDI